jgi:hypothetical protein
MNPQTGRQVQSKIYRDVEDVVDEGGVRGGVIPVETPQVWVVNNLVGLDVDGRLRHSLGATGEVGVQSPPVLRTHGAEVPKLNTIC